MIRNDKKICLEVIYRISKKNLRIVLATCPPLEISVQMELFQLLEKNYGTTVKANRYFETPECIQGKFLAHSEI